MSTQTSFEDAAKQIESYLTLEKPESFFLCAGAGSGKTRMLVASLESLLARYGDHLRLRGQQIAVITYTNAACNVIKQRMKFDALIDVRTIHSFAWEVIKGFTADIREFLEAHINSKIAANLAIRGRAGSQASVDRAAENERYRIRLSALPGIRAFSYSPDSDNKGRDSLSHPEVLSICAAFLEGKSLMQEVLVGKYPVLLIDECQDTNRHIMDAVLAVQNSNKERFCVGLFGDGMQRIYTDGKKDIEQSLGPEWKKPEIFVNNRSPRRIVDLINKIRVTVDPHQQTPKHDALQGEIRLFIAPSSIDDKLVVERRIRERMSIVSEDSEWSREGAAKILTLEHIMAAVRLGFFEMYEPLWRVEKFKNGLRKGELPITRLFTELALPLVQAKLALDEFRIAEIVKKSSPLLERGQLEKAGPEQFTSIEKAQAAIEKVMLLFAEAADPSLGSVMRVIATDGLFTIPEELVPFLPECVGNTAEEDASEDIVAVRRFLAAPFSQVERYSEYVKGNTCFDTHQGVKGLEFNRVMVVMDDAGAGGFRFSYERLFGISSESTRGAARRSDAEPAIDSTRRLFYVTCSRSMRSLALVAYTADVRRVRDCAIENGWFEASEIEEIAGGV